MADLTEEELAVLAKKAIEESAMEYMLAQGYQGELLQAKYNEEVERLINEAEAAEQQVLNAQRKTKPKAKSTIPEDERKRMVEELIINDFGPRNSVSRWQDKRLREEYKGLLEWKKKFPDQYKPYDPQAIIVKSSRTTTTKSKPTPSKQTKTYTVMIPSISQDPLLPHTKSISIQQDSTKCFDIHAELDEDEKILITEQYDPKDVGVMETTYTKGTIRPKRTIMKLPVMTKPTKSSVTIRETSTSPSSAAQLTHTPQPSPTQQSKQLIPSMSQRPANIVKWSIDKKTQWMMITMDDGLTTIYKDWYEILGMSAHHHKQLMNMNIEYDEEEVPRAKEFELEIKGQIWQRYFSRK